MAGSAPRKKVPLDVVWREARELVWARRGRLAAGLALLAAGRLAAMVLPASTKIVVDEVIGKGRLELLTWIALAAGAAAVVQAGSSYSLSLLLGVTAQLSINELRRKVQSHVMRLPISYFDHHKSGELISRIMTDAEGIRNLVGTGFVQLIGGALTAGLAFAILLWIDWRLTSLTIAGLALFGIVMFVGFSRLRPIFRQRSRLNAALTGRLAESLGGIRVVKAFTAEKREELAFTGLTHRVLRNVLQSMVGVSGIQSLSSLIFGLTGIAMAVVGARRVIDGAMTVGDLFMFVAFTGLMVAPLVQIAAIGTQITEAFAGLDRIREVLRVPREDAGDGDKHPVGRLRGDVAFEDVSFEYLEGVPVLESVAFSAAAGTTTALVGPSGAGKSTIIGLILAFRHPTSGRVLVDGLDLARSRLSDYRRQLAVVLQDDFLFDGSVAENIGYGKPGATRAEIEAAGGRAHCDEFVDSWEDGYDTVIGERGVKLSGGQKQRVAIARAILADPRILILDEATSSLDSESELLIQRGLQELRRGRTTFVIAHRLSTVQNADQILVVDGGRIVERGRHDELLAGDGRYRSLYETQYRIESDRFRNPGETPREPEEEPGAETEPRTPTVRSFFS